MIRGKKRNLIPKPICRALIVSHKDFGRGSLSRFRMDDAIDLSASTTAEQTRYAPTPDQIASGKKVFFALVRFAGEVVVKLICIGFAQHTFLSFSTRSRRAASIRDFILFTVFRGTPSDSATASEGSPLIAVRMNTCFVRS